MIRRNTLGGVKRCTCTYTQSCLSCLLYRYVINTSYIDAHMTHVPIIEYRISLSLISISSTRSLRTLRTVVPEGHIPYSVAIVLKDTNVDLDVFPGGVFFTHPYFCISTHGFRHLLRHFIISKSHFS